MDSDKIGRCGRCAARFDIDLDEERGSSRLRHADPSESATLRATTGRDESCRLQEKWAKEY
jgi:hypothetical protein